jgi:medium-chain acyl-[acyl-carrier-protein] hydrolase
MASVAEPGIFRHTFPLHYPDADAAGRLRLTSLLNLLQEHAGGHATQLGFDYHRNKQDGIFWVLSRLSARFDGWAAWPGELTVDTWIRPPQGLLALRDFRWGAPGGWHGRASSAWVLLQGKRPLRLTDWLDRAQPVLPEEPASATPPVLPPFDLEPHAERRAEALVRQTHSVHAVWEDIDLNQHVNNANAVGWCLSQHEPGFLTQWRLTSLDVNFLAEMFWGQKFRVVRDELPGTEGRRVFDYLVVRDGDQAPTLRLRMEFGRAA